MPNLAPGLIFIIAWIFRMEKVNSSCTYSRIKIVGTFLCVSGALTLSIMQSISAPKFTKEGTLQSPSPPPNLTFDRDKLSGCLYLMAAVLILSSNIVLQAFTLGDFPAPMSLSAITCFFGTFMTAAVQLIQDHEFKTGWPVVGIGDLIGYYLLAGVVSAICSSVNCWVIEKRGPVFVSMFSPIGTVCSVIFSVVTLGQTMNTGSLAGMFLMFTGLYIVLWAKGKEGGIKSENDAEKPLLKFSIEEQEDGSFTRFGGTRSGSWSEIAIAVYIGWLQFQQTRGTKGKDTSSVVGHSIILTHVSHVWSIPIAPKGGPSGPDMARFPVTLSIYAFDGDSWYEWLKEVIGNKRLFRNQSGFVEGIMIDQVS
ncbi:unnamed protein product [Sphenostylis stenocarpa]|uniref:WAT1-related protein n=1 Tax=Sphenostylis stenocarpa TaxID=92480 RepID=A0AA86SKY4_9FABA|nr:unnamed protein product [Sphenostylis stenocarpa]